MLASATPSWPLPSWITKLLTQRCPGFCSSQTRGGPCTLCLCSGGDQRELWPEEELHPRLRRGPESRRGPGAGWADTPALGAQFAGRVAAALLHVGTSVLCSPVSSRVMGRTGCLSLWSAALQPRPPQASVKQLEERVGTKARSESGDTGAEEGCRPRHPPRHPLPPGAQAEDCRPCPSLAAWHCLAQLSCSNLIPL